MFKFIIFPFILLLMAKNLMAEDILLLTINLENDLFNPLIKDLEEIFTPLDSKHLTGFKRKIKIERYDLDISFSYNQRRRQFYSSWILDRLKESSLSKKDIILGILDVDLYVEGLNFVFGEADPLNRIAVISAIRLRQEFYGLAEDKNLFYKRTLKEAVHEIGHIFGLPHCPNSKCAMHFSNSLLDTDKKDFRFCPMCKKRLE